MRKKVNFLMLTLITMFASLAFSSCSKDDEPAENYYLVLTNVSTNLVDSEGQYLADSYYETFIADTPAMDSDGVCDLGKLSEKSALKTFDKSVENFRNIYNEGFAGNNILPEGGYIIYYFALKNEYWTSLSTASFQVTNDGASY